MEKPMDDDELITEIEDSKSGSISEFEDDQNSSLAKHRYIGVNRANSNQYLTSKLPPYLKKFSFAHKQTTRLVSEPFRI